MYTKQGAVIMQEIEKIVTELRTYFSEEEWFEFKENWYEEAGIGGNNCLLFYSICN